MKEFLKGFAQRSLVRLKAHAKAFLQETVDNEYDPLCDQVAVEVKKIPGVIDDLVVDTAKPILQPKGKDFLTNAIAEM